MVDFQRLDDPLVLPLVPPALRYAVVTLWTLDARLGEMARSGKEPALRQIRLTWWEEQLGRLTPDAAPPEPLLAEIAKTLITKVAAERLAELADAWTQFAIAEEGEQPVAHGALLFGLTGELLGKPSNPELAKAGEGWAMVDRLLTDAVTSDDPRWQKAAAALAMVRLRALPRPIAALTGVARRIARHGGIRSAGAEQWTLFKIGLIGR